MATMPQQQTEAGRAGARFDRRQLRLLVVVLTVIAAAIGAAVAFTQPHSPKTTSAGITATLHFPGAPDPLAAGADALWVGLNPALDRGLQHQKSGSLERVNLTSGAVERTLHIPGFVGAAMLHVGDVLWVAHGPDAMGEGKKPAELDARDWTSGRLLGRLRFEHGIFDLAYGDRSLWVTVGSSPSRLVRVDPATRHTIGKPIVVLSGHTFGSAFGGGAVWETGFDAGSLARIDPMTGSVRRVKVGDAPVGVVFSRGSVWVALRDLPGARGAVARIDPRTLHVLQTTMVGRNPSYLAAAGGLIWVGNQTEGTVTRIDPRTGDTVGLPIRITANDVGRLVAAGRSLWIGADMHSTATRIDVNRAR